MKDLRDPQDHRVWMDPQDREDPKDPKDLHAMLVHPTTRPFEQFDISRMEELTTFRTMIASLLSTAAILSLSSFQRVQSGNKTMIIIKKLDLSQFLRPLEAM